ncbi:hypothetical protein [Streptomyces sp. NPDC005548]|uniref:hypothetical protein n=1 Tax=Streptomyces sp. NPDC005548 TaxID=3364724 RepID=UPI0036A369E5
MNDIRPRTGRHQRSLDPRPQTRKALMWGSPGPNDYHGQLRVTASDLELHTEQAEGTQIDEGLQEALNSIKNAVEHAEG